MIDTGVTSIEIVELVPRPGARDELLALRPRILEEYDRFCGGRYDAVLTEREDGAWVDVWRWAAREDAEAALADIPGVIPSFARWQELVELRSLTWLDRLA